MAELPRDLVIYVNCQSGLRSYLAMRILAGHGLRAINLDGGYKTYIDGQSNVAKQAIRPPLEETLLVKQS